LYIIVKQIVFAQLWLLSLGDGMNVGKKVNKKGIEENEKTI
jgi:hypothetical protein